jgi:hypothetical protein
MARRAGKCGARFATAPLTQTSLLLCVHLKQVSNHYTRTMDIKPDSNETPQNAAVEPSPPMPPPTEAGVARIKEE